jgi:hypothetical protein
MLFLSFILKATELKEKKRLEKYHKNYDSSFFTSVENYKKANVRNEWGKTQK